MNKLLILLVENDVVLQKQMEEILEKNGYRYLVSKNGTEAIKALTTHNPDLILLDLKLPDVDGIELIRRIREWSFIPIMVVNSRMMEKDLIEALDSGADDYLMQPFSIEEFLVRIRVIQRRLSIMNDNAKAHQAVFVNGPLKINYVSGCTYLDDVEIHLTPIEYKLLCLLARNVGKVLTHTYITQNIWGNNWENNIASLRVFMATLRKKVERTPDAQKLIQTHIGIGYRMLKIKDLTKED